MKYVTTVNGKSFEIDINQDGRVIVNGEERAVDYRPISESLYSIIIDNASFEVVVEKQDNTYQVLMLGDQYDVEVMDERQQRLSKATAGFAVAQGELSIKSPMPGLIVEVKVTAGQTVEKGQALIVLESMKMENEIRAPRAGTVARTHVSKGESVEQNKVLITLS